MTISYLYVGVLEQGAKRWFTKDSVMRVVVSILYRNVL